MRGRGLPTLIVSLLLLPVFASLPTAAQPQEGDVVATGHIPVGQPATGFWGTVWYHNPTEFHWLGLPYGFSFDAAGLEGLWLRPEVQDPTGAGYDVAVYYFDENGYNLETQRARAPGSHALGEEPYGRVASISQALVPQGAVTGYVYAALGVLLDINVVVADAPQPLPAGVLAIENVPAGVPKGQEALWILGSSYAPTIFSVRADVADLNGVRITPEIVDIGGIGYELRMVFRAELGTILEADCTPSPDATHPLETGTPEFRWSESCIVPDGAVLLDAALYHGQNVDVTLHLE